MNNDVDVDVNDENYRSTKVYTPQIHKRDKERINMKNKNQSDLPYLRASFL